MNFNYYLFGNPQGQYNQYPDDYTASILNIVRTDVKYSRLVIHRDMDIMHYIYIEPLDDNNYIGMGILFNKAYIKKPHGLISLFRSVIDNVLIQSGEIIRYTSKGDLQYNVIRISDRLSEYEKVKSYINSYLEKNKSALCLEQLASTYNGIKKTGTLDTSASDAEIVSEMSKYNTLFIESTGPKKQNYIDTVIVGLRTQNENSQNRINELSLEINKLNKTKKQYKVVLCLFFLILCCGVGIYFLNDNLVNTQGQLDEANSTISEQLLEIANQQDTIKRDNQTITSLISEKRNLQDRCNEAEGKLDNITSVINTRQPIIITGTSINWNSGYLSFDYYSFKEESIAITIRTYNEDGYSYVRTENIYVYNGAGHESIYAGRLNGGKWYSFVLSIGNTIIGGDRH